MGCVRACEESVLNVVVVLGDRAVGVVRVALNAVCFMEGCLWVLWLCVWCVAEEVCGQGANM